MVSEDIHSLWRQFANCYTDNPNGMHLNANDFQELLGRLWELYHASIYLESKIAPEPKEIEGENVLDFSKFRELKNKRRV